VKTGEETEGDIDHFPGFAHDDGFTPKASQPVTEATVVALNGDGVAFGLEQFFGVDYLTISFVLIGAKDRYVP
jgi:hypothetical protein